MSITIGSLFSGIGGLELGVAAALGGEVVWQVEQDPFCQSVLRKQFPDSILIDDVHDAGSASLPSPDVICGGFPCQDLSVASSTHTGLDGDRSGLFFEMVRVVKELEPKTVVIENVPRLLSKYRDVVEAEMNQLGYGVCWVKCAASDVGAPHLRRRVFLVCQRNARNELINLTHAIKKKLWPTPTANPFGDNSSVRRWLQRRERMMRNGQRPISPPLAIMAVMVEAGIPWPPKGRRWHTPSATDWKGSSRNGQRRFQLTDDFHGGDKGRLNPDWVTHLMGLPAGWLDGEVGRVAWPAPRPDLATARNKQHEWEPPRLLKKSYRGRAQRLKALGNAVVPQQAAFAIKVALS